MADHPETGPPQADAARDHRPRADAARDDPPPADVARDDPPPGDVARDDPPPGDVARDDPPLAEVCAAVALDHTGAVLLHARANSVYHLPRDGAVVRLRRTHGAAEWLRRLTSAVRVTAWLAEQGFPTIRPLPLDPVTIGGWTATFWRYVPFDGDAPGVRDLAAILRDLHALPAPPIELVPTNPLGALPADLERAGEVLPAARRDWLRTRAEEIAAAYPHTEMPLGRGMLHGDAHGRNLFPSGGRFLLGDWDSVSFGPQAQDLVPTLDGVLHFGLPRSEWTALCATYGADPDIEHHPGMRLLSRARELRSLAAYIRAGHRPDVRAELDKRLDTLIHGSAATWRAV